MALTGGIATGKSHVRARFESLGIPTVDADILARDAVAPGSAGLAAVVHRFGTEVCDADGTLNRRKVGAIVFRDPQARRDLEQIVHPYVREMTERWFASLDPQRVPFAVADIPLLFEGRREADFEAVIVTACEPATQLNRLMARDGKARAIDIGAAWWQDVDTPEMFQHAAEVLRQSNRAAANAPLSPSSPVTE